MLQHFKPFTAGISLAAQELVPVGEILAAFSYALDLTAAQPAGHSMRSAYIAVRMAKAIGLSDQICLNVHYTTLLKDLGCSSNASQISAQYLTDDRAFKHDFKQAGNRASDFLRFLTAHAGRGAPFGRRIWAVAKALKFSPHGARQLIEARSERGAEVAAQLRLPAEVSEGIRCLDEHWDGSGFPRGLAKDDIPLTARLALLAQMAEIWFSVESPEAARDGAARMSGRWFDPGLVALFRHLTRDPKFWTDLIAPDLQTRLMRLCDGHFLMLADDAYLNEIASAFGGVIDAKSPFTADHSRRVSAITDALARVSGLGEDRQRKLIRAAMLHDIGKLGVSNLILDKPGSLTEREWTAMQMHAENTTDILGRVAAFSDMAMIAGSHHERLDGAGYPLGLSDAQLVIDMRILAAADVFEALTANRPYRAAMECDQAMDIMRAEAGSALDPMIVEALDQSLNAGLFDDLKGR